MDKILTPNVTAAPPSAAMSVVLMLKWLGVQEAHLDVCDPVALKPVFFVQHALNEASPLYGKTPKDLKQENGFIALTISATDDSTLQTLHSRALYSPDDIRWNHTFEVPPTFCFCPRFARTPNLPQIMRLHT